MKMKKKREKKSGGRGMCTKNGSYCEKEKKLGGGGQDRFERRSEAFVKIQKYKKNYLFFWGGGGGGGGRVGGGGGGSGWM